MTIIQGARRTPPFILGLSCAMTTATSALATTQAAYFVDGTNVVLDLLQGEVTEAQVAAILARHS